MTYYTEDVDDLRRAAAEINLSRRAREIVLPPGVLDLGDEPLLFGGLVNQKTIGGLLIRGAGIGMIREPSGRFFGGSGISYSGRNAAIRLQGVSHSSIRDLAVYAPLGTGIRIEASLKGYAPASNNHLSGVNFSGSGAGLVLHGADSPEDYIGRGTPTQHSYGQVDMTLVERCLFRDCNIGFSQDAPNMVNNTVDFCEFKCRTISCHIMEGTFRVTRSIFVDDDIPYTGAALHILNGTDIVSRENRFELDRTPAYYMALAPHANHSQFVSQNNLICHGPQSTPGIRIDRRRITLVTDDELTMRGTKSWRMEIAASATWLERRPRNPQVEVIRT